MKKNHKRWTVSHLFNNRFQQTAIFFVFTILLLLAACSKRKCKEDNSNAGIIVKSLHFNDCDKRGNVIEEIDYTCGSPVIIHNIYEYDGNNNLIKSYYSGITTTYKYDEKGNIIEQNDYTKEGYNSKTDIDILIYTTTYKYDKMGNKIESIEYDIREESNIKTTYKYDKNGKLVAENKNTYNQDGSLKEKKRLTGILKKNRKPLKKELKDYNDDELRRLAAETNDKKFLELKRTLKTLTPELFKRWVEVSEELIALDKIDVNRLNKMSLEKSSDYYAKLFSASLNATSIIESTRYKNQQKYIDEQRVRFFKKYSITSFEEATAEALSEWEKIRSEPWDVI